MSTYLASDPTHLRRMGAAAAYRRLKHRYPRETTLVALYALHGALTGVHWQALPDAVKEALRRAAGA